MNGALDISLGRMGFAYLLFLFVVLVTWRKHLSIGRDILHAVSRMTLQLILMGFFLTYLFRIELWFVISAIFFVMVFFAAQTIVKRSGIRFRGVHRILYFSILGGGGSVLLVFLLGILNNRPWFNPRYFIPLSGMIIGNSMNGSALALERFFDDVKTRRTEIETSLSFGASSEEASSASFRKAYRSALIPTLTSMTGMGIVFLPGMMTGQILGGSPPMVAIKYQIAIMGAILGSVALTCLFILSQEQRQLFTEEHLIDDEMFSQP